MQSPRPLLKTIGITVCTVVAGATLVAAGAATQSDTTARQLSSPTDEVISVPRDVREPRIRYPDAPVAIAMRPLDGEPASYRAERTGAVPAAGESAPREANEAASEDVEPVVEQEPSSLSADNPTTTTAAPVKKAAPTTKAPATTTTAAKKAPATTTTVKPSGPPLMVVDFSRNGAGSYTDADVRADFGAIDWSRTERASIVQADNGNKYLRVEYPKGGVGPDQGGAGFITDFAQSIGTHDELYVSYRVRFGADFDWKLGGKLPGLGAGTAHSGGQQPDGRNGWSARMMWKAGGAPISYVYHPDQPDKYGHGMAWNGPSFKAGTWATVETRIKLNTPGQHDGVIQGWMNGELVLERTNLRFRDTPDLKIENLLFSTFFGGNDANWAASRDEHIDFDDFLISKYPITH